MALFRIFLCCVGAQLIKGFMVDHLNAIKRYNSRQIHGDEDNSRTPSDIRIRAGERTMEIYWTPPEEIDEADFCVLEYKDSPLLGTPRTPLSIMVPFAKTRDSLVISDLQTVTRFGLRLYCFYGNTRGPPTDWVYAATRTVSVDQNICPGSLPNAFLEPTCVETPSLSWCEYTCAEGYRINDVAAVLNNNPLWGDDIYIFCRDGMWITNFEKYGHKIQDICLPEAAFQKCPASIPNGKLKTHCGPATDWLCEFECNTGYARHPFMHGRLKGFNNPSEKLFCGDDGTWKTGYEDIGLDVAGVCFPRGFDQNCTSDIPHGSVYKPCPSGHVCDMECNDGYRARALAGDDWLACLSGEWTLSATKYDPTITPQTVCVPEDVQSSCPSDIPNGRIPDGCTANCAPICNEGYLIIGETHLSMAPKTVTCENGQWLTVSEPYTGDNICFPEGGILCPPEIPNADFADYPYRLRDWGKGREYMPYRCHDGYRYNRGIQHIECVAGKWVTWNERFGIGTSDLCIPVNQN